MEKTFCSIWGLFIARSTLSSCKSVGICSFRRCTSSQRSYSRLKQCCVCAVRFSPSCLFLTGCLNSAAGHWVRAHSSSAQAARVVTHACHAAVCWECGLCPHEPPEPQHSHVQHAEEDDACDRPCHKGEPRGSPSQRSIRGAHGRAQSAPQACRCHRGQSSAEL